MSIHKSPLSPQPSGQNFDIANYFRSEKIQKSRNSMAEEDSSVTLIKDNRYPFQQNDTSIFQRSNMNNINSLNNTRLIGGPEFSGRVDLLLPPNDDAAIPIQTNVCSYCNLGTNLIPICPCTQAHQDCATQELNSGTLITQATCHTCKEFRQVACQVVFDFSKWRQHKQAIAGEVAAIMLLLGLIFTISYVAVTEFEGQLAQDRLIISCLVFSYTVGFILLVCMITRIMTHFKKIQYRIKRYDARNVEVNRQYINLLIKL